jgi:hypothetical protein
MTLDGNQQVAGALRQGMKPTALFCAWNDFVKIVTDFNAMGRASPFCGISRAGFECNMLAVITSS